MSEPEHEAMQRKRSHLAAVEAFSHLSCDELERLEQSLQVVSVPRGQVLMRQGDPSNALFIVVSGRFRVERDPGPGAIAEIGAGSPIGEIAFFAGGTRTATVTAERDSLVLELKREDFDRLAHASPQIWNTITAQLAQRLGQMTVSATRSAVAIPRTITVCRAGPLIPPARIERFIADLRAAFDPALRIVVLDADSTKAGLASGVALNSSDATHWFNALETSYDHVIYVADQELTEWTKKALRQADQVLCVADADAAASRDPNLSEHFAERLHAPGTLRLVLLQQGTPPYDGTRLWLEPRRWIEMHHHVRSSNRSDYARLVRYVRGEAIGLVACGGGAYSSAHIGIFEALEGAGICFDALGGTSGGAAMTAALALGVPPEEIERRTHEIFVARKAMRRWTWPRYSLLDHTEFDRALAEHFTSTDIEDLHIPFFAVATNLSRNKGVCLHRGPLWQAIRASAAIPALLPPVFTPEGEMLVDGCVSENVPVTTMLKFKSGPNVIIDFHSPEADRFEVDSGSLPTRGELVMSMLTFGRGRVLPDAPGPSSVLLRALMLNRPDYATDLGPGDILLAPMLPLGIGPLDWHRHADLRSFARDFAQAELARLKAAGHPLLKGS